MASEALKTILFGPWSSVWFAGNTLDSAALLLTASLGALLAFRAGLFNLGGEGQIYLGGLAASAVLLAAGALSPGPALAAALSLLAAAAAALTGGLCGCVCGLLQRKTGALCLITSFLLSAALTPLADALIAGPLRDRSGSLMATAPFDSRLLLPRLLEPSNLSLSAPLSLGLCLAAAFFLHRTGAGYRFRAAGADEAFARYGGIETGAHWVPAMTASGALSGLTGYFAVAGAYGLCHLGFPGGLGWSALAVSLVARNSPLPLIACALLFASLKAGVDASLIEGGVNLETTSLIQAAALILAALWGAQGTRKRHA